MTLTASTGLLLPLGSPYKYSSGATVTIEDNSNHYVMVDAPGTSVSIDYRLDLDNDGVTVGTPIAPYGYSAGLDMYGHWEDRYNDMTATVNPSDGGHQAGNGAWIQLHQLVNTRASADRTYVNYHVGP